MNGPSHIAVSPATSPVRQGLRGVPSIHRVGVLVLGMHRSGTSALTRMLNLLGCSLPRTLLGANDANPTGHWESREAMVFNDDLLSRAGSAWDDWTALAEGFFTAPGYSELLARGGELLRAEYDDSPLFVFKDPRNCRLARFWLDVFAAEAIHPFVVIPIRNPLEVAQSLNTRDHSDEHYGPLLWLRHVLDAEAASRGRPRAFTAYDQMVDCWEVVAGRLQQDLGIAWPRMSPATHEEIDAYIDKSHRHETVTTEALLNNQLISDWVRRTWEILHSWALHGEDAANCVELDAIAQAFDDAAPAFARLILRGKQARHQLQALERALAESQARMAQIELQTAQQLGSQHEALTQETTQVRAECAALHGQIDELTGMRDAAEGSAVELGRSNAELQGQLAAARAQFAAVNEQFYQTTQSLAAQINRVAELESALIQRREENEQAWRDVTREQATSADLRDQLAKNNQREGALQRRLAEADAWVFRLAAQREAAQHQAQLARTAQLAAEREMHKGKAATARQVEAMAASLRDAEASASDTEVRLEQQIAEVARLTATRAAEKSALAADLTAVTAELGVTATALQRANDRLGERDNDTARLNQLVREQDAALAAEAAKRAWLQNLAAARANLPLWWRLMPREWRRRQEHQRLLREGLFDASAYVSRYPDVAVAKVDPLQHYITCGMDEGRSI